MKEITVNIEINGRKYGTTSKYTELANKNTTKFQIKETIKRLLELMEKEQIFIKE